MYKTQKYFVMKKYWSQKATEDLQIIFRTQAEIGLEPVSIKVSMKVSIKETLDWQNLPRWSSVIRGKIVATVYFYSSF